MAGRTRFTGTATTIACFEDNSRVREAVREPGAGKVLVADGGARDVAVEVRGARIAPGMRVVVDEDGVLVLPAD